MSGVDIAGLAIACADTLLRILAKLKSQYDSYKECDVLLKEAVRRVTRIRKIISKYAALDSADASRIPGAVLERVADEFREIEKSLSKLDEFMKKPKVQRLMKAQNSAEKLKFICSQLKELEYHLDLYGLHVYGEETLSAKIDKLIDVINKHTIVPNQPKVDELLKRVRATLQFCDEIPAHVQNNKDGDEITNDANSEEFSKIPDYVRNLLEALSSSGVSNDMKKTLTGIVKRLWCGWQVNEEDVKFLTFGGGLKKSIGQGASSTVYKALLQRRDSLGEATGERVMVAVKEHKHIRKNEECDKQLAMFIRELFLQMDARHPCIVHVFGGFLLGHTDELENFGIEHSRTEDESEDEDEDEVDEVGFVIPYIVMEKMTLNLRDAMRLKEFEDTAFRRRILKDVADGVAHLHARGIVHRDIKPENVLLRKVKGKIVGHAKLGDFGVSRKTHEAGVKSSCARTVTATGTYAYMPPEVLKDIRGCVSRMSWDVWSFGILACEVGSPGCLDEILLSGSILDLMDSGKFEQHLKKVMNSIEDDVVRNVAMSCLKSDRTQRLSMKSIVQKFHPVETQPTDTSYSQTQPDEPHCVPPQARRPIFDDNAAEVSGEVNTFIGIDLGATNSSVGVWRHNRVELISNSQGNRMLPSYVAFADNEILVGDSAKNQAHRNTRNTIFDVKRFIGRRYSELISSPGLDHLPFCVIKKPNDDFCFQVWHEGKVQEYSAVEISAILLQELKKVAEAYLGEEVIDAVITIPVTFNSLQRSATRKAAEMAGLRIGRLVHEPTAAAMAYGLDFRSEKERNVLIYDLGGGSCDVSLLTLEDGIWEVKAIAGNTSGGRDFDNFIVWYLVEEFTRKHGKDPIRSERAMTRLRLASERTKRTLSSAMRANLEIDSLYEGIDFFEYLSRAKFEELCVDLFKDTLILVQKVLNDAKMPKEDVHDVVLVGGSTRIPEVQSLLSNYFDGKELCKSINPEEAVTYGAVIQTVFSNSIDSEQLQDCLLLDVIPRSLGIESSGGVMETIIKRNSTLPTRRQQIFTTQHDNQTSILIQIYEGEHNLVKYNRLLDKLLLSEIDAAPRGVPQIEITFDLDIHDNLIVQAIEISTGNRNRNMNKIGVTGDKGRLAVCGTGMEVATLSGNSSYPRPPK